MGALQNSRRFRLLAGTGVLLWVAALVFPYHPEAYGWVTRELVNLLHVPLGFSLAAILFPGMSGTPGSRLVRTGMLVLGLLGLAELIQPWIGRDSSLADWLLGAAGMVLAGLAYAMKRTADHPRWYVALAWVLVASGTLIPSLRAMNDGFAREDDFPVLASFERSSELNRWTLNGVTLTRVGQVENPSRLLPERRASVAGLVTFTNAMQEYPGLFLTELIGNWTNAETLHADLYWSGAEATNVEFRLDDLPGNPPYAERFQTTQLLNPGWNECAFSLADMENTPSGRRLRFDKVRRFGFFFLHAPTNEHLILDNIRLTLR